LNYTDGRTYTWNTSIEHQFGSHWLAKAAYVGSESDHQAYLNEANLSAVPVCGPVNPPTCLQVTKQPTLRDTNFSQIYLYNSDATANYQSGQFTLEKRFNHGLQFTANYTYSHTIDIADQATAAFNGSLANPGCVYCNRANSYIDTPHVFVANFIYETPTLEGWNRATKLALGGWQLSGIYRAQSGQPFTIVSGQTSSWQGDGSDHPDFASGVHKVHTQPGNLAHYLVASDFATPVPGVSPVQGTSGDIGRNPAFQPGINTWDMGMSKNFHITERYRLQFRWEMFNAFNRVTFGGPNSNASSSSFGLINGTNGNYPARVMQGALKFTF
jgi:hypothetical protein